MSRILLFANSDWYLYNYRQPLVRALISQGNKVFALTPPGPYVDHLKQAGIAWHPLQLDRKSLNPVAEGVVLARCIRSYRSLQPDLTHHFTSKPILYGSIAKKWTKIPAAVNSVTGQGYLFGGTGIKVRAARPFVRSLLRYALADPGQITVFQHSSDRRDYLDMHLVAEADTRIIPGSGVDPNRFHLRGEPDGHPVVLMVSRLLWSKGVGDFIDLSRHFQAVGIGARMVLIGDVDTGNPDSVSTEKLDGWQQQGLIEWLGHRADVEEHIGRCSVVVLPTRYREGIPRVLLEAAASEKPIVATNVPGCRDVVSNGRNGILVTLGDQLGFQQAVEALLLDPALRRKMGTAGRNLVLERFTEDRITEQTLEIYEQLL